jgi:hypothetical protein
LPAARIGPAADVRAAAAAEDRSHTRRRVTMIVASTTSVAYTVLALSFTVCVLGVVFYGLVRPFTHLDHRHPSGKLFDPLD